MEQNKRVEDISREAEASESSGSQIVSYSRQNIMRKDLK